MERRALMERCAYWAPCFWLISPKWLTFQAKDMHIRELNNKVLGKSAIKKGGHFSRGRPFKIDRSRLGLSQYLDWSIKIEFSISIKFNTLLVHWWSWGLVNPTMSNFCCGFQLVMVGEIISNSTLTSILNYSTSISLSEFDIRKTLINAYFCLLISCLVNCSVGQLVSWSVG